MASMQTAMDRIATLLLDDDHSAWTEDRLTQALQAEIDRLARQHLLGDIRQAQAVAGQGRYPLPPETLEVAEVLYDGTSLFEVSEESLSDHKDRWEETRHIPKWWTQERQPMGADDGHPVQSLEISPAPLLSGSDIPVFPAAPLAQPIEGNLVFFTWISPTLSGNPEANMPVNDALETIATYRAVGQLSAEKTDYEDVGKAAFFEQLGVLMLNALEE